ncbi:MAG: phosphatase PAP2 family protein [Clostridia bacterium]|nr:phosphatase PAP2 family protein [Clostridia bacterium]
MTLAGSTFSFPWEIDLIVWLQNRLGAAGIPLVSFFSEFGEELFAVLIIGFVYWSWDKELGKRIGFSVLMAMVWTPMAKNVVLRPRPYFESSEVRFFRAVDPKADIYDIAAQGYSFPSGHSATAAALYGAAAAQGRHRILTAAAVILCLLVGFSRVAVGAHYPSDVLAGWLVGLLAVLAVRSVKNRVSKPWMQRALLLLTALPGLFFCRSSDYFASLGLLIGFLAADCFEANVATFENTRSMPRALLRVLCGAILMSGLNTVLKVPLSSGYLNQGSAAALLLDTVRYGILAFVCFALYPMAFRLTAGIGRSK